MFWMSEETLRLVREVGQMGGIIAGKIKKEKMMDYNEELKKIRKEFPLEGIEPPLSFGFLIIKDASGVESFESIRKNTDLLAKYRTERIINYQSQHRQNRIGTLEHITEYDVLDLAIKRAIDNGYYAKFSVRENIKSYKIFRKYYSIIFSHDFAKAFWMPNGVNVWKAHLQQMVLYENPIDYLRNFI